MEKKVPQIIYEDKDLVVINKPAGMVVNNADTSRSEYTLQDFVNDEFRIKSPKLAIDQRENSDFNKRSGIVHRLDKETSGAIIVALNPESFLNLQKQFKEKTVKKVYTALCHGKLVEEGEINVPIGRLPWNRMRFGVISRGRQSYTKFKAKKYLNFTNGKSKEVLTLAEVYPQTGRTHQIRVHFQYVGHPLFADDLYAGRKMKKNDRKYLSRHFLHASKISFTHPMTRVTMELEVPLPSDLVDFLSQLT